MQLLKYTKIYYFGSLIYGPGGALTLPTGENKSR